MHGGKINSAFFKLVGGIVLTSESKGIYCLGEKSGIRMPEKSSKAVSIHRSTFGGGVEDGCVRITSHRVW